MQNKEGSLGIKLILICFAVAALDQLSKLMVLRSIKEGESITLIPNFFDIILTYNKGAAFGLFANLPDGTRQITLGVATFLALVVISFLLLKEYKDDLFAKICLSFILGGALGNLIDRVFLGKVVDFLDVYIGAYHWPAFNIADSAISVGVTILIIKGFFSPSEVS